MIVTYKDYDSFPLCPWARYQICVWPQLTWEAIQDLWSVLPCNGAIWFVPGTAHADD